MMPKWQRKTSFKGLNGIKKGAKIAPLFWCYYPQRPARDNSRAKAHIMLEENLTKQSNKGEGRRKIVRSPRDRRTGVR